MPYLPSSYFVKFSEWEGERGRVWYGMKRERVGNG